MVYHEVREANGKMANYLIQNKRVNGKFKKTAKFVGYGEISKSRISKLKESFEEYLRRETLYKNLTKEQVERVDELSKIYLKGKKRYDKRNFDESFFTELTYDSNAIEGSTLTLQETSLVINDGIVPKGKSVREIYEAKNHLEAIIFIQEHEGALNELFILKLHKLILKEIFSRYAGVYRDRNVRIQGSSVKLPNYDKVPQLMKNLIYWYNKNKKTAHPFELAIIFSMKFVTIHPFIDGNGRVSRLLMNFILNRFNQPWINIRFRNREEYIGAVELGNKEKYEKMIEFSIEQLEENIRDLF
ncbi:MAG: Fic family protein [Nanoarchaeota archaeon]|jgi:Fic family protein|nr:Fic family protein [Nanoarchaeota archaeon]